MLFTCKYKSKTTTLLFYDKIKFFISCNKKRKNQYQNVSYEIDIEVPHSVVNKIQKNKI